MTITTPTQEMQEHLAVTLNIAVPAERINDMLCSALEGGSVYWAVRCSVLNDDYKGQEYAHQVPMAGGTVFVFYDPDENGHLPHLEKATLDRASIDKGMAVFQTVAKGRHLVDLLNENDDAETGDVFLQCCLFGEVVYS